MEQKASHAPRSIAARFRDQILDLRAVQQSLDEARRSQWKISSDSERTVIVTSGSEFPNKISGKVLYTNDHFVVIGDEQSVTTVRHDGRSFTVGDDVVLGWHWRSDKSSKAGERHVFTAVILSKTEQISFERTPELKFERSRSSRR